jgi:hypothetical protein
MTTTDKRIPFRQLPLWVQVFAVLLYALAFVGMVGAVSLASAGVLFVWRHLF